jgi:hypothetical protein
MNSFVIKKPMAAPENLSICRDQTREATTPRRVVAMAMLLTAVLMMLGMESAAAQDRVDLGKIFQPIKPGHKVTLAETGGGVEIQLLNDGTIGTYTVVEIGAAHLVLQDISGLSRRWIPVTAVRAVVWTRLPTAGARQPGSAWRE